MAETTVNGLPWLRKRIDGADPDFLRDLVKAVVDALMGAEADNVCGAAYGAVSPDRVNQRNGYRERPWDTRVGTISLAVPKLRRGSYFPDWLLEPRRRAERCLVQVIAECYVRGVSTRRVDGLVKTLGISGISKSQVSELAKELDAGVEEFRNRKLEAGPYPYVWLDAMTQRNREGGRVLNVATVVATGVNREGKREILGMDVITSEDGAGWTAFLRGLVARGLTGVSLVISDAHAGLKEAIAAVFPGTAWQRCRAHFMRNLLTRVAKPAQDFVATLARSIFAQPDAEAVFAQHGRVVEQMRVQRGLRDAAEMLEGAGEEILAFAAFPKEHWKQIWSNNPQERLNKEIRRRTDVVGIFPDRGAIIRLVGAVLAEQNDEWAVARRYFSLESLQKITSVGGEKEKLAA